ncbi:nucleotide exchange factor GrpE [Candidatus Berkelbacteria bacterium CG_4_9_14_3_um_filter_39_23]|uniref:Protein GrpE n=2 Tax=Candidatus Berkelbacteria TaxID=1618330 RepID=A0A2M7CIT9_9BACT|nr:nucleotide exchange factor GrpE [Candidatus Berkelbacteria bacterium]PIR27824.1 MAG: nucleotide exchange factor GrpE [Candidatus Berkelbacteria bacterium CG11_big_fil_rev_8_21_14_0_20_40_23]PIV25548.1 MAG: nucleotide exchange factor GrpE [Candidatus Berkelbacteria bacterium CG03_land_8_20_14_0_80_40_36]PJB51855.1 MAG: nucleotide exchange factor GrpE [Candidatus Berkelbacteria bacterium CG_4_9_14_3_um_filter_39_23]
MQKITRKKIKKDVCEEKNRELTNALQRERADFENFRKRMENEKADIFKFVNENLILELLPVLDNFTRSLEHTKHLDGTPHQEGLKLIKKQLEEVLKNNGLTKIEVKKGDVFDPAICEAVSGTGDIIAEIVLVGYRLNDKIIRAVKVVLK